MSDRTTTVRGHRTNVQKAAAIVGVVFLLVGVLGFIPGITTNFGDLSFAGHNSDAKLFGLFQVSILHNIVHLLFGIAGLAMARTAARPAPTWCSVARYTWCCLCTGSSSARNRRPTSCP
jgi:Domain of unknown function (DUF4383)